MRLLNVIELYEARALAVSILGRRRSARVAEARGNLEVARRCTVDVVLLKRRMDRLGRKAA